MIVQDLNAHFIYAIRGLKSPKSPIRLVLIEFESNAFYITGSYRLASEICNDRDGPRPI